jgi:hypothetical protein
MRHLDDWTLEQLAEGMLPEGELGAATEHVEGCRRCAAELEGYRALHAALAGLPRLAPSPGFGDAVMARVKMPEPSPVWAMIQRWLPSTRRGWTILGAALVAPALPLLAGLAWLLTHPGVSAATLWQTVTTEASAMSATALEQAFAWGLDSGLFGSVGLVLDALGSVPLETLAGLFAVMAIAIPLSGWSLFRLVRAPMRNATYAN